MNFLNLPGPPLTVDERFGTGLQALRAFMQREAATLRVGHGAVRVLVVDDDADLSTLVSHALVNEQMDVVTVGSIKRGIEHMRDASPDCVLLDYRLPDGDGLTALRAIRRDHATVPVVIITGLGSEEVAVEAMKLGAADYVVKAGRWLTTLALTIREVVGRATLDETGQLHRPGERPSAPPSPHVRKELLGRYRADDIVGVSPGLTQALRLADQAAQDTVAVLIEGETGTGKELLARAVHRHGPRAKSAFVSLNCAALTDTLLESELFGHVRGAFTGADAPRRGLFEEAHGGTLFLDEIGEMSLPAQAKLLRILDGGELRPVGSSTRRRVDVRVIAATNRDLLRATREGRFRGDLYYRLAAFPICLPPLRERIEDIEVLAEHLLARACRERGKDIPGFQPRALRLLAAYSWPGNVRQLRNEVDRLAIIARPGQRIAPTHLSSWVVLERVERLPPPRPLKAIVRDVELATIRDRLRQFGYHRDATARSLGMTRVALWGKLRHLGFKPPGRRRPGE